MTTSVVTGDIDNDGIREIFVGTIGDIGTNFNSIQPNLLLKYNTIYHFLEHSGNTYYLPATINERIYLSAN